MFGKKCNQQQQREEEKDQLQKPGLDTGPNPDFS